MSHILSCQCLFHRFHFCTPPSCFSSWPFSLSANFLLSCLSLYSLLFPPPVSTLGLLLPCCFSRGSSQSTLAGWAPAATPGATTERLEPGVWSLSDLGGTRIGPLNSEVMPGRASPRGSKGGRLDGRRRRRRSSSSRGSSG